MPDIEYSVVLSDDSTIAYDYPTFTALEPAFAEYQNAKKGLLYNYVETFSQTFNLDDCPEYMQVELVVEQGSKVRLVLEGSIMNRDEFADYIYERIAVPLN